MAALSCELGATLEPRTADNTFELACAHETELDETELDETELDETELDDPEAQFNQIP
jgi:hypothetical protein